MSKVLMSNRKSEQMPSKSNNGNVEWQKVIIVDTLAINVDINIVEINGLTVFRH